MLSQILRSIALVFLLALPGLSAEKTHPFSVHDMVAMDRISDPQVSPDNDKVVFVLRKTDLEANRGKTDLWLCTLDGDDLYRLTTHPASEFNPRWDPDGESIWFLSTRSGSCQVWRIFLRGGEAVQVTDLPLDVGNLVLSPDGERIAFTAQVFPDTDSLKETQKVLEERAAQKFSGRIYDKLFIRHWDTWKDGRYSHLFVMSSHGDGEPVDLMKGMEADTPSMPFGGPEEIAFAPDGKSLIFTARDAGREEAWSTNFDLFSVPVDGGRPPLNVTEENKAWDTLPVFSPDGKTLAHLAMAEPGYEADRFRIVLRSWPESTPRALAPSFDRSPRSMIWAPDGKHLYVTASNVGQVSLFKISLETGEAAVLWEKGTVGALVAAGSRILIGIDNLASPVELHVLDPETGGLEKITGINDEKVAAASMGDFEQFTFNGWNDEEVYAYLVKPVDFDPTKKYPLAFLIHGGPQGSFGNHFHYRWNPQAYAGAGYAAVMVDFHGSTGYGQAFTDSIEGDWGGKPLEDLKKGLDAALKNYPWIDGERVGALGGSFGGYMINWIEGNWPDRFKCLVNHDGNLDERFAYYDTEELWFPERDHQGTPWTHPEGYEEHNPINFIANWKTPMLVIHGALDFRVVETQGIATFTALQRMGIPSRLLYFPDENHWVLKPHNSILWYDTVLAWMDQWVKGAAGE